MWASMAFGFCPQRENGLERWISLHLIWELLGMSDLKAGAAGAVEE
jgi:hypothetical protein